MLAEPERGQILPASGPVYLSPLEIVLTKWETMGELARQGLGVAVLVEAVAAVRCIPD